MAVEMIESIRSAEEQAAGIRRKAAAEAKRLLAAAEAEASASAERAEKDAGRRADELLNEAKQKADSRAEAENARFYERIAKLRAGAEANLAGAADFILKELFAL